MRAVVMRVTGASVSVDDRVVGKTGPGFLILLGVKSGDTQKEVQVLVNKIIGLRVFADNCGKMNLPLSSVGGSLLVISQFTLYGNCRHGRRPDYFEAARSDEAAPLYELFVSTCRSMGIHTETGIFGADMQVSSVNDGPVTLILDTDTL